MSCTSCSPSPDSTWSGITRVHSYPQISSMNDGIHAGIQLNSYKQENGQHLYAMTLGALQIVNGQFDSRVILSLYATSEKKFNDKEQKLSVNSKNTPLKVSSINVSVIQRPTKLLIQSKDGVFFEKEQKNLKLLKVTAKFNTFKKHLVAEAYYPFMKGCFVIQRKCIHDRCGPSWLHNPCNYRCILRACGNRGQCGDWGESGETCTILPCTG